MERLRNIIYPFRNRLEKVPKRLYRRQRVDCVFLNLPPCLILSISDFLSPVSCTLLSQTCQSLRVILEGKSNTALFSREQYLDYLACLTRDIPQKWVCQVCLTLHHMAESDTPVQPQNISCPLGWKKWSCVAHGIPSSQFDARSKRRMPEHHHVQLALKFSRLRVYPNYLRHLLQGCLSSPQLHYQTNEKITKLLDAQYLMYPKIIKDTDDNLRYLLSSRWSYRRDNPAALVTTLPSSLRVCPHLFFRLGERPWPSGRRFILNDGTRPIFHPSESDSVVRGACTSCPTDFTIRLLRERAEIRTWQDLGPECSPESIYWRVHLITDNPTTINTNQNSLPVLRHEPGSIRALWARSSLYDENSNPNN
jgi:hypothetical protein